jgi:hypothetical protein
VVPWAKLFGLLLIVVVLFIVIVPDDVDLPPTVTPSSHAGFRIPSVPITVLIQSSVILGLPQNPVAFAVRIVLPDHGDSSGSLIDLNCTRLC